MNLLVQAAVVGFILGLAFFAGESTWKAIARKVAAKLPARLPEKTTIVVEVDSAQAVAAIDDLTARLEGLSSAAKGSGLP